MAAAVGFSDLPTTALDEIARRVGPLDNVRCSAVCRSWRAALNATRLRRLGGRPNRPHSVYINSYEWSRDHPTVELTPIDVVVDDYEYPPSRKACSSVRISTAERPNMTAIGCSYGWVIAADRHRHSSYELEVTLSLLDPLTGRLFRLPRFTGGSSSRSYKQQEELRRERLNLHYKPMFSRKAALAPGRRLGTYAVMVLHSGGRGLSYLKPGAASSWTALRPPRGMPHRYVDVVAHKGAFCTLSCYGEVNAWAPDGGGKGLRTRRLTEPRAAPLAWAVLAQSASREDLLMVSTTEEATGFGSRRRFEVSRCDELRRRWVPVDDLGENAILAGIASSLCVSTRSSLRDGPRGNYIYFARDCRSTNFGHSGHDYGNPDAYRLPIVTERLPGGQIYGNIWFLPYVAGI